MREIIRPSGGHILDIDSLEIGPQFLSLANNVDMRRGFPSRIRGRRSAYAPPLPTTPYHLLNFTLNGFNWWMFFGTNNVYAIETSNEYNISPVGISAISNPHQLSSTLLNTIPVFTNGINAPYYWNGVGASVAVPLPGFPAATTCRFIVAFRFHLFALNIESPGGTFDNLILWSTAAVPGAVPTTWTPAAGNEAGSAFLADTQGRCIAGKPLGTQLMIYKPGSVYAIEYAGEQPTNIFKVRPVLRSIGLMSPHCLQTIKDSNGVERHAVVGNDDVILTDGVSSRSIADSRVKRALASSIDETNKLNTFSIWDRTQKELWVCVPESGSQFATKAHIWDQERDNWVTRDLAQVKYGTTGYFTDTAPSRIWNSQAVTWDNATQTWNEQVQGTIEKVATTESNLIYEEDVPPTVAVPASIKRLDMSFEDATVIKTTNRVWIEGSGTGLAALNFRLGARNSTDEGIVWGPTVLRDGNGKPYEITGRFISIEIFNNTGIDPWTVTRFTITAEPNGEQ